MGWLYRTAERTDMGANGVEIIVTHPTRDAFAVLLRHGNCIPAAAVVGGGGDDGAR